ncbi:MAG: hypothetical protein FWF57_05725 [Defluviitaleaceae bacterium]|nr:hypothetical protein [Defluviitaleaceae bacterium]
MDKILSQLDEIELIAKSLVEENLKNQTKILEKKQEQNIKRSYKNNNTDLVLKKYLNILNKKEISSELLNSKEETLRIEIFDNIAYSIKDVKETFDIQTKKLISKIGFLSDAYFNSGTDKLCNEIKNNGFYDLKLTDIMIVREDI